MPQSVVFVSVWERASFEPDGEGGDHVLYAPEARRNHATLIDAQVAANSGYRYLTGSEDIWAPVACREIEEWRNNQMVARYAERHDGWQRIPSQLEAA